LRLASFFENEMAAVISQVVRWVLLQALFSARLASQCKNNLLNNQQLTTNR
jgi:hypothetical protein